MVRRRAVFIHLLCYSFALLFAEEIGFDRMIVEHYSQTDFLALRFQTGLLYLKRKPRKELQMSMDFKVRYQNLKQKLLLLLFRWVRLRLCAAGPLTGRCPHADTWMNEQRLTSTDRGLGEKPLHFDRHKSHLGANPGLRGEDPVTKRATLKWWTWTQYETLRRDRPNMGQTATRNL